MVVNLSKSTYNLIHKRRTIIAGYFGINYLLQTLVFLANIGIVSIASGSKGSKLDIFYILFS